MSLKGKLAILATQKIAKTILSNDTVSTAINNTLTKHSQQNGQKTATEHIQQIKSNYLVIKAKSFSFGTMLDLLTDNPLSTNDYQKRYQIFDMSGSVKYKSDAENTFFDRDVLNLYDTTGHRIGYVKEHLLPMGIPLLEKEVNKCSVYRDREKIAEFKKYTSFGELEFEVLEGAAKIYHNHGTQFKLHYNGRLIAILHDVPKTYKDDYVEKFVLEYDNPSDEIIAILLAIAIDLIRK